MQSSAYHLPIITGVILIRTQISIANSSPLFASLAAMTTSYPLIAKYRALCDPIPPVAPVTTAISRLGGCRYRRPLCMSNPRSKFVALKKCLRTRRNVRRNMLWYNSVTTPCIAHLITLCFFILTIVDFDFAFAVAFGEFAPAIADARVVLMIISCATTSLVFLDAAATAPTRDDFFVMLLAGNADALNLLLLVIRRNTTICK